MGLQRRKAFFTEIDPWICWPSWSLMNCLMWYSIYPGSLNIAGESGVLQISFSSDNSWSSILLVAWVHKWCVLYNPFIFIHLQMLLRILRPSFDLCFLAGIYTVCNLLYAGPRNRGRLERLRDDLGWVPLETDEDKRWVPLLLHWSYHTPIGYKYMCTLFLRWVLVPRVCFSK